MAWQSRFDDFAFVDTSSKPKNAWQGENVPGSRPQKQPFSNCSDRHRGGWQAHSHDGGSFSSNGTNKNPDANGIKHIRICDLTTETSFVSIIGLIISKEGPKSIFSKKGTGTERHLVSFTLRDDPTAFINITCWGGQDYATRLSDQFKVGDVVEVKGAQVQAKSKNPSDEKFKPWTPSSFCLNLGENHGELNFYYGLDAENFSSLLRVPTRASNDFYTLEDIQANGMNLHTEHINIFALVKKVWPVRALTTKTGKHITKVDVVLCDETCSAFQLTLWGCFVNLTDDWKPLQTVLFAADVRITYSDFHSAMVACTDSKTVFTVDPDTLEAQMLSEFGRSQFSDTMNHDSVSVLESVTKDPEISSITNVLMVREVKKLQKDLLYSNGQCSYGVVYAFLSHFDIDADNRNIVRLACSKCHKSVNANGRCLCRAQDCSGNQLSAEPPSLLEFNVTVSLTDESGSLEWCYVAPAAIEQLLECSASEFQAADDSRKTRLKWQYLFERMKGVVKISGSNSAKSGKSFVRVMALEKIPHSEVLSGRYSAS